MIGDEVLVLSNYRQTPATVISASTFNVRGNSILSHFIFVSHMFVPLQWLINFKILESFFLELAQAIAYSFVNIQMFKYQCDTIEVKVPFSFLPV